MTLPPFPHIQGSCFYPFFLLFSLECSSPTHPDPFLPASLVLPLKISRKPCKHLRPSFAQTQTLFSLKPTTNPPHCGQPHPLPWLSGTKHARMGQPWVGFTPGPRLLLRTLHDHFSTKLLHQHWSQTGTMYRGVPAPFSIKNMQDLDQKPTSWPGPASFCLPRAPTTMPPHQALLSRPHCGEEEDAAPLKCSLLR